MNNKTRYAVILKDGQEPIVENGKRVLYLSPDQVGTLNELWCFALVVC